MNRKFYLIIVLLILVSMLGCTRTAYSQITETEKKVLLNEKGKGIMAKYIEPEVLQFNGKYYELVESGYDNKLITLNNKNEFCYLDLTIPEHPQLKVISPGFPGVNGLLGSDAENRVAWLVRGRGVYMIDLDSGKTGHIIAGNYGRVDHVLLTDKERLLFVIVSFSVEAQILYAYELLKNIDHGQIGVTGIGSFYSLGKNVLLLSGNYPKEPEYTGWYLSDSFLTEAKANPGKIYPGTDPLTKELMKNNVHGLIDGMEKQLHQRKRLLFGWSYTELKRPTQPVLVHWDESIKDISIDFLLLQMQDNADQIHTGPFHISGDGNWMKGIRIHTKVDPRMEELVVWHLQDYYPQSMSMGISLGYTNKDPGAFMNHSKLGPCYVEKSTSRDGILFLFKLNDGLEILKETGREE